VKIVVDLDLCQGHGACAEEAPEVFEVGEKRGTVVLRDPSPPEALRTKVAAAVKRCPTRALRVVEE
jgi:ferredoxin